MILDSLGVGEADDASKYNSKGANTLGHILEQTDLFIPNLKKIGLLNTINMDENENVDAYYTIATRFITNYSSTCNIFNTI